MAFVYSHRMDATMHVNATMGHTEWLEISLFLFLGTLAAILPCLTRKEMPREPPADRKRHGRTREGYWRGIPELQLLVLGLPLELLWETAQFPLYTIWHEGTWSEILYGLVHCTLGDLLILLAAYWLIALFNQDRHWSRQAGLANIFLFTILGSTYTVYSEIVNVHIEGNWDYTGLMPIVPLLDIGGTPFLQWLLIPPLLLWLMRLTSPCPCTR